MATEPIEMDRFMEGFKYYKQRQNQPNYSDVLDMRNIDHRRVRKLPLNMAAGNCQGFIPIDQWKAYEVLDQPGFYVIENPFLPKYQRYWIKRCLADYTSASNVSNLSAAEAHKTYREGLMSVCHHKESNPGNERTSGTDTTETKPTNSNNKLNGDSASELESKRNDSNSTGESIWAEVWRKLSTSEPLEPQLHQSLLWKLRWVTMGYHYDWTNKVYYEGFKSTLPEDLDGLCQYLSAAIGCSYYRAEAVIVNYYHLKSTLSAHTDHSEFDLTAPLFSISFGNPCIFMIGGKDKSTKPSALFLRTGDIAVMAENSRLCYHAVPKVMQGTNDLKSIVNFDREDDCPPKKRKVDTAKNELTSARSATQSTLAASSTSATGSTISDSTSSSTSTLSDSTSSSTSCPQSTSNASLVSTESPSIPYCNLSLEAINDPECWSRFDTYLKGSRININVRQMFEKDKTFSDYTNAKS